MKVNPKTKIAAAVLFAFSLMWFGVPSFLCSLVRAVSYSVVAGSWSASPFVSSVNWYGLSWAVSYNAIVSLKIFVS